MYGSLHKLYPTEIKMDNCNIMQPHTGLGAGLWHNVTTIMNVLRTFLTK
jgi:hypothetical protein